MGIDTTTYLGAYFECSASAAPAPTEMDVVDTDALTERINQQLAMFQPMSAGFPPDPRDETRVLHVWAPNVDRGAPREWRLPESPEGLEITLIDDRMAGDGPRALPPYRGPKAYHAGRDETDVHPIDRDVQYLVSKFHAEMHALEDAYGVDNVRLRWGLVRYCW